MAILILSQFLLSFNCDGAGQGGAGPQLTSLDAGSAVSCYVLLLFSTIRIMYITYYPR